MDEAADGNEDDQRGTIQDVKRGHIPPNERLGRDLFSRKLFEKKYMEKTEEKHDDLLRNLVDVC